MPLKVLFKGWTGWARPEDQKGKQMTMQSESIEALASALLRVQATMGPALKDEMNPFYGKKYADLASVWAAVRQPMADNGLSVAQGVSPEGATGVVWTQLMHTSGQWLRSECPLILAKTDPQGVGSAITYYRRYLLAAMLGVTQEDDDAESAMPKRDAKPAPAAAPKPAQQPKPASPPPPPPAASGLKPEDIPFDGSKPGAPTDPSPAPANTGGVEWKPVFKLTPEETAAWKAQGWSQEKRASRRDPSKAYIWVAVPDSFDPGAFPMPPPVEQPAAPAQKAQEQAPEGGKVDAIALTRALQVAETREELMAAWDAVVKVQASIDSKTLVSLGKLKRDKEAGLPS